MKKNEKEGVSNNTKTCEYVGLLIVCEVQHKTSSSIQVRPAGASFHVNAPTAEMQMELTGAATGMSPTATALAN